ESLALVLPFSLQFCIIQRYQRRDLRLCELLQIDDACSAYLSRDSQPQASSALEELCFLVMGFLQKPQVTHTKDYLFLFHYSKTHDSGNSDIVSSVLHPLLQLVPQLNERRLKRYKVDVCNLKLCMLAFSHFVIH
uniref:Neuromedin U n=1 Tax=Aquila chrysaetos chrysaetos TaxID=223781 RepID=A0A663EGG1_AQUCH